MAIVMPAGASESSGAAAWGLNSSGQLGNGSTTSANEAIAVKTLTEATAVAGGESHSLALLKSGKVMAWGLNSSGQLGNGTTTNAKEPVEVKGLTEEVVAIAAGSNHSLAVLKSGKVKAWGSNVDGQLGNNSTTNAKEPVEVKGLTEAVSVAGGEFHSLALLKSGKVKAWGLNSSGQLGNNSTTNAKEPVEVKGLTEAEAIAAGHNHSLAVLKSGKVKAWGNNADGQLGNNSTTNAKEPVEVKGIAEATAVAGGEFHSQALLKSGTVMAWGLNSSSQLGNGSTTTAKEPVEVKGLTAPAGGISAGANFSLAAYANAPANTQSPTITGEAKDQKELTATPGTWSGTPPITYLYQWQECNTSGESCSAIVGANTFTYKVEHAQVDHTIKVRVTAKNVAGQTEAGSAATATVAAAAPVNSVAPTISGEARDEKTLSATIGTWTGTPPIGYDYQWQSCNGAGESCSNIPGATSSSLTLGHEQVGRTIRIKVSAANSAGEASAISSATRTVAGASEASGAAAWGLNNDGQLGNGTTTTAKEAGAVKLLTEAASVAAGEFHSLALLKNAKVMAWGLNGSGQLGNGSTTTAKEPVEVKGLTEVIAIAAGANHSLALLKNGKVKAWGLNSSGQLGNGSTTSAKEPVEVKGLSEVVAIAAGSNHSLAVLKNGKVKAWGSNVDGQLGNNSTTNAKEPVEVKGLTEAIAVAGGEFHSLAVLQSGKVKAWGLNSSGQLGNGSTATAKEPVEVKGLTEAEGVAAGHNHSLALLKSGKVKAWGNNVDGQLGNGLTANATEPVEVKGLTQATAVAGGAFYSLALRSNGEVTAWGLNASSQLGNGTSANASEPVQVKGLAGGAGAISTGASFSLASYATAPANTQAPTITGEAKDGQTLTATAGTWTGTPPITSTYQWQECNNTGESCSNINNATTSSYLIPPEQVGHAIRVVVTASNGAGAAAASSAATAAVTAVPPSNSAPPTISGSAQVGQTLEASTGTWTGTPTITYAYQWESCTNSGQSCSEIAQANNSTFLLTANQIGTSLRVTVTATNPAGHAASTSAQTAVVTEAGCDDSWTGGSAGRWEAATNWSNNAPPSSTEVACIGSAATVEVPNEGNQAAAVKDAGRLTISGSLELLSASKISTAQNLTIASGKLTVTGELHVTGAFVGGGFGGLKGSGSMVIEPAATGTITPTGGKRLFLSIHTLRNAGTLTIEQGAGISAESNATIVNSGTLIVNGEPPGENLGIIGEGSIANTGTIEKAAGTGTSRIALSINNEGLVRASSGRLEFTGGGTWGGHTAGTWSSQPGSTVRFGESSFSLGSPVMMSGTVEITGGKVTTGTIEGATASVEVNKAVGQSTAKLEINGTFPSTLQALTILGGTQNGTGDVDVTKEFIGGGFGTLSGTGTTVLEETAKSTIQSTGGARLFVVGHTIRNAGTLTVQPTAGIQGEQSPTLTNSGTLIVNGEPPGANLGVIGEGSITNTGTIKKTEGSGITPVAWRIDNEALVKGESGELAFTAGGTSGTLGEDRWVSTGNSSVALQDFPNGLFELGEHSTFEGNITIHSNVAVGALEASKANLTFELGAFKLTGLTPSAIGTLSMPIPEPSPTNIQNINIKDELQITNGLNWAAGDLEGPGNEVLEPGSINTIDPTAWIQLHPTGQFVNEGILAWKSGGIDASGEDHRFFVNLGTFNIEPGTSNPYGEACGAVEASQCKAIFENDGTVIGTFAHPVRIGWNIENYGAFKVPHELAPCEEDDFRGIHLNDDWDADFEPCQLLSAVKFTQPELCPKAELGGENEAEPNVVRLGDDVNSANGNLFQPQTDLKAGGRGLGLDLTRSYNSGTAFRETLEEIFEEAPPSIFGHGWTSSFMDHLVINRCTGPGADGRVTVVQSDGSEISFIVASDGRMIAGPTVQATLVKNEDGTYTYTLPNQTHEYFTSTGRLSSESDRYGNATTVAYNEQGRPANVTDPSGRTLTFAYNAAGEVETVTDPTGQSVDYSYNEAHDLTKVTYAGEANARWEYGYNEENALTGLTDGNGHTTKYTYDNTGGVKSKEDPLGRTTIWSYTTDTHGEPHTTVTNPNGSVTEQTYKNGQPVEITRASGKPQMTTEKLAYNENQDPTSVTDGNGHTTEYTYDGEGDKTSETNADQETTHWTYDRMHDIETMTTPRGETTTFHLGPHGEVLSETKPAPNNLTQETSYTYTSFGERKTKTDPNNHTWSYEYDSRGNLDAETDPEGDKTTYSYDLDSRKKTETRPRGNLPGAEPEEFTTILTYNDRGNVETMVDGLGHTTKYGYDGNENRTDVTDPEGHHTHTTFNAANEPAEITYEDGSTEQTGYDSDGNVTSHTDGNHHTTKYERNPLEEVAEVIDPDNHKTLKEYDKAGNLTTITDAEGHVTTNKYDPANRLVETTYSDGNTAPVQYEYNTDGDRTLMTDGTGTSTCEYDQLDRLTATKNGHGDTAGYEYDLANHEIGITYPNGKSATRGYDNAGRLQATTDWLGHTTEFHYDANSNVTATVFPQETGDEDKYAFDPADAMKSVEMKKGTFVLASIAYARNNDSQVAKETREGLPGAQEPTYTYDKRNRLKEGGNIGYEYDAANNPETIGAQAYSYDAADQLETSKEGEITTATYTYNGDGERTKTTPTSGPATTYGYDQAENLATVTRAKEGATPAIADSYSYNGDGLRTAQTMAGHTKYDVWDTSGQLPLILDDGTNSYIYGPHYLPVEQLANEGGAVAYLHHDQQGSTRLLTNETGAVEGKCTYAAYGAPTCEGSATTPLGYDGEYTDADTGLVYLRARYYDSATSQFVTLDPKVDETATPYGYAEDDPINRSDPSGLIPWSHKVKAAIAKCRGWKRWYSRRSPYYSNKGIYNACQNLLSVGPEVPGTESQAREVVRGLGHSAVEVGDTACKQWLSSAGIPAAFAFQGAIAAGTAACGGWVLGRAVDSLIGIG